MKSTKKVLSKKEVLEILKAESKNIIVFDQANHNVEPVIDVKMNGPSIQLSIRPDIPTEKRQLELMADSMIEAAIDINAKRFSVTSELVINPDWDLIVTVKKRK